MIKVAAVCMVAMLGCEEHDPLQYSWDDSRVVCSMNVDNTGASSERVDDAFRTSVEDESVALMHAHSPGDTIWMGALEHVLQDASESGLDFVTYPELTDGPERPGIALAFDDANVDAWYGARDLFAAYGAHVTFFVTYYAQWTDDAKAKLATLAADGHAIEAHGVNHLNAIDYLDAHTPADYVANEVVPSIDVLERDGYRVTTFAFPFGASTDALDEAALRAITRVRVGPKHCPHPR